MKVYVVKTAVSHDNESFVPGDEIELSDEHAEPLLEVGAIEDPSSVKKVAEPKRKKVTKK